MKRFGLKIKKNGQESMHVDIFTLINKNRFREKQATASNVQNKIGALYIYIYIYILYYYNYYYYYAWCTAYPSLKLFLFYYYLNTALEARG